MEQPMKFIQLVRNMRKKYIEVDETDFTERFTANQSTHLSHERNTR